MFSAENLTGVSASISRVAADGRSKGEVLATFAGHWDGVIEQKSGAPVAPLMAGSGGGARGLSEARFLDVPALEVQPKLTLPLAEQGPWESRRLWQFCSAELLKRPTVDWALVDREKGQLEEEQRLLACHEKEGSAAYSEWPTKRFHARKRADPLTGKQRDFYTYDGAAAAEGGGGGGGGGSSGGPGAGASDEVDFIALSRSLPDPRGGLNNAGAVESVVQAMKTIALSARRVSDRDSVREGGQ